MFHVFEKHVQRAFASFVHSQLDPEAPVLAEQPKDPSFGEIALPVAFQLARKLKRNPREIAAGIVSGAGAVEGMRSAEVIGNGYINIRFDRGAYGRAALEAFSQPPAPRAGKIIVEHTNINPNKAAHIGHLRNAVLGDSFIRILRASGNTVEVQNYIDNTGVQVADVVVAFHFLEKKTAREVEVLTRTTRFDYLCWDLYARMSSYYKEQPESTAWRAETLHSIEAGHGELSEMGHIVADAIVECHLATMRRLGITYDVLPRESEILHLQFWATAFEQLKERKAIYLETEGKNKGCWVMPGSAFSQKEDDEDSKVIVRSNGTVTYVGKDIAYQLWKFGLLGKDFHYREWKRYDDGHRIFISTTTPGTDATSFGKGTQVFNVIDSRQSYLQDVVVAGLRQLGYTDEAEKSVHFSYEMVALSHRTCAEMGIELSEEDKKKPYAEVSGRKGLGVKADDLIDKLIETAQREVDSRHAEAPAEERRKVAEAIATGALRYFLLKFSRNTVIAFDLQEALSFEGDTGPYVQYAAVRARNILRKLEERGGEMPDFASVYVQGSGPSASQSYNLSGNSLTGAPGNITVTGSTNYEVSTAFNNFYHAYPVLTEEDAEKRALLLWMTQYFHKQLQDTLRVLGISVPPYM
ncbi:MAG: arginine--tRNA ligase [Candidatus Solibacter usitatus]|nr:arginine--tRNA ligase [Candidatus Solibacter usitatus]